MLGDESIEAEDASAPRLVRFGTIVGGGVVAAIAASLPAELRIGDGGSVFRALEQWLALSALITPLGITVVAVFRRARVGLRLLAGDRVPLLVAAALWWAVLELGVLAVFGAVLRAKTHHHGLAGVTFAIVALVTGVVIALLAVRGARMLDRLPRASHRGALVVAAGAAFLAIVLVGFRTSRAEGLHTAAALVDTLALGMAASIASTRSFGRMRPLALLGVPLAALILFLGFMMVLAEPNLSSLLANGAPVHAWVLALIGH